MMERHGTNDATHPVHLEIHPALTIGGHTISVRRQTDEGLYLDVGTFNVTVQDYVEPDKPARTG